VAVVAIAALAGVWLLRRTPTPPPITPPAAPPAETAIAGRPGPAAVAPRPVLPVLPVPRARRDVVLITVDTLRADHLPVYGYSGIETPFFDRLAAEGVRFASAATTVPFTLPAHSSIMTGCYPPRHGVRENVGYSLDPSLPTLAEVLTGAGWATAGFVSAFVLDGRWGIGRGFATYFDHFDLKAMEHANLGSVQRDGAETVAAAVAWLDRRPRDRPFFLWLHLYDPHEPYTPPEPFRSRYPDRPYDGEIAYSDSLLARFRSALAERGLFDDSLVIVTGDHGEGLGDHGEAYHGYFVYDSTVHVPLIVRLPGGADAGRVVASAVSHVDLLPTVLDLVGVAPPAGVQGRSLAPLLAGGEDRRREVYSESLYPLLHYGWAPLRALRTGDLKLIAAPRPELYDLQEDPGEETNLVSARRAEARGLAADLTALRQSIESAAPAAAAAASRTDLDEEALAQLRALGYVAGRGGVDPSREGDAERADPKDEIAIHRLIMAAQSAIGGGDEKLAAARLQEVLARDPGVVDAHQMLGNLASEAGRHEAALGHFQRALALEPEHRAALFGLAASYRALGKSKEALVGFRRLLALNPRDAKAAVATADLLVEGGKQDEALQVLETAVAGGSPPAILLNRLGELFALTGRPSDARARFEAAIAAKPDLALPHFNLAALREEEGDLEGAAAEYRRAIELQPKYYQAQFNLGRLAVRLGDAAEAERQLAAAVASNPEFVQGYLYLSKLLMDRGELGRAEERVRQGLAHDAGDHGGPFGWFLLADILNRTGRRQEAAEAARRGREIEAAGRGGRAVQAAGGGAPAKGSGSP
jgi:arylsulfatase A-like enzyme/Tfp pilus assembly protein PilF